MAWPRLFDVVAESQGSPGVLLQTVVVYVGLFAAMVLGVSGAIRFGRNRAGLTGGLGELGVGFAPDDVGWAVAALIGGNVARAIVAATLMGTSDPDVYTDTVRGFGQDPRLFAVFAAASVPMHGFDSTFHYAYKAKLLFHEGFATEAWTDLGGPIGRSMEHPSYPPLVPALELLVAWTRAATTGGGFDDDAARPAFSKAVYVAQFADHGDIGQQETIGAILTRLGHDSAAVLARASSQPVKDALRTATEEAQRLGIFGAPAFIAPDGELFWGNDRLDQALAWAKRQDKSEVKDRQSPEGSPCRHD